MLLALCAGSSSAGDQQVGSSIRLDACALAYLPSGPRDLPVSIGDGHKHTKRRAH